MPTVTFQGSRTLWNEAFPHDNPWNAAKTSIPEKLKVHPELLLVAIERGTVAGSIMGGYDGHRGWISRAAVLRSYRGRGIGKALVEEVEKRLAALGCIEVNLQVVASNAAVAGFDRSLGYRVEERG
jgi:ribosomal protein S18 acetylase RimI-like enzyme